MASEREMIIFATSLSIMAAMFALSVLALAVMAWERERLIWFVTSKEEIYEESGNESMGMKDSNGLTETVPASHTVSLSSEPIPTFPRITMAAQFRENGMNSASDSPAGDRASERRAPSYVGNDRATAQGSQGLGPSLPENASNGPSLAGSLSKVPSAFAFPGYSKENQINALVGSSVRSTQSNFEDAPRMLRKRNQSRENSIVSSRPVSWHSAGDFKLQRQGSGTTVASMSYADEARSMTSEGAFSHVGFELRRAESVPVVLRINIDDGAELGGSVGKLSASRLEGSLRPIKVAQRLDTSPDDTVRQRSPSSKSLPGEGKERSTEGTSVFQIKKSDKEFIERKLAGDMARRKIPAHSTRSVPGRRKDYSIFYDYEVEGEKILTDEQLRQRLMKAHERDDIVLVPAIPRGPADATSKGRDNDVRAVRAHEAVSDETLTSL